jgi:hypothetical protein
MASAEEYAAWIVANQDKRDSPEFQTVAEAYKQARGAAAPKVADTRPEEERPALSNPSMAAQFSKARENVTPPTSVTDPRYADWRMAQDQADALDAIAVVAMPILGGILAPGKSAVESAGKTMMQRAMKPLKRDLMTGKAQRGAETLLKEGINVTPGGMEKLRTLAEGANDDVARIIAGSSAQIDKGAVARRVDDTRRTFTNQVVPQGDLAAIDDARNAFLAHPAIPGQTMPIQQAQSLKQGTYKQLKDRYGELSGSSTEAQKALARGLKEEIEAAAPAVGPANARAADLWNALNVSERRALLAQNNNPLGLAPIAGSMPYASLFLLDRSPLMQSYAARLLYNSGRVPGVLGGAGVGALMQPEVRGALLSE